MMQTETSDQEILKVKELWGENSTHWHTSKIVHWTQHPKVRAWLNLLASGNPTKDRFQYFIETYLQGRLPVERSLALACGHGELGRSLSKFNFALAHEGIDISDGAVAKAVRMADELRLKNLFYRVADLNSIELPQCKYDVVFAVMAVHHVRALEHLFQQVSESLKPNGYFFLDEFIGPTKFQWRDEQLAVINDQIAALPPRLKVCINNPNCLKEPVRRLTLEEMDAVDPSEAVRSSEIMPLLSEYFDVLEVKGCGGSLLHPLLEEIVGNFSEDDPEAMRYLRSFFTLEDELITMGKLQHDFAVIVAAPKGANHMDKTTSSS